MVATIHGLDDRGSGRASVWRENELGNKRKLKLTIPQTLPGEDVQVTVDKPEKKRWRTMPEEIISRIQSGQPLHAHTLIAAAAVYGSTGNTKASSRKRPIMSSMPWKQKDSILPW